MKPFRPSAVSALVCALVLSSCGGSSSSSNEPEVLSIIGDAAQTQSARPESAAGDRASSMANIRFELQGSLPALDSDATAYALAPSEPPTSDVERLLKVFGIEGDLVAQGSEVGGGYMAGATDGSASSFYVGSDPLHYWSYTPPWSSTSMNPECFDMSTIQPAAPPTPVTESLPPADSVVETIVPDDTGTTSDSVAPDAGAPDEQCVQSQEPVNVPTDDEARALFADLMSKIDVDIGDLDIDVFSDSYGASVTGFLKIDGIRSPLSWSVGFADDSRVVWAGGILAEPKVLGSYPRIGTTEGLDRLNAQQRSLWQGVSGDVPDDAVSTSDSQSEPVRVVIVDVEEELVMLNGVDGSVYLVPGYAFLAPTDEFGFEPRYTVSAVPDAYVKVTEPDTGSQGSVGSGDQPVATDLVPGSETGGQDMQEITLEQANTLLGMSEQEATQTAQANGWTVRIAARDGEQFALTMDYSPTRVNLTVDGGFVTYVFIG